MIRTLITKEILNNIMNLRFTISLLLSTILTISCVVILTHQYHEEMDDFTYRQSLQDEFLDNYAHTNRIDGIIIPQKPPEVFRPFIIGIPHDADVGSFDDNPMPVLFPHIDFLFIVTIIMSLMAILFSYDAVTGDRNNGTLKLQTSYPISRALILFGKWVGGMVSLILPFLLSLVVGALYITVHPQIHWDGSTWLSFVLLFFASVTFISLFFLLGLFISCLTRYSSVSILASLFVWVMLILVIPNTSPHIAAQLYRIPSVTRVKHEINRLTSIERDDLGRKLSREVDERFSQEYGQRFAEYRSMSNAVVRKRVAADSDLKAMHDAYRRETGQAWNEANRIQTEKAKNISDELYRKATNQTIIAKNISCISPYVNYVFVATDLTGTGLRSHGFFNSNFREIEYLYYGSDGANLSGSESRGLGHFNRSSREYTRRYYEYQGKKVSEASKADPTFDSNTFLDISDRQRFSYKEEPLKDRLQAVMSYWGILMFFNILFFAGAFVKFIRYDVR